MPDIDELEKLLDSGCGSSVFQSGVYWSSIAHDVESESAYDIQNSASLTPDANTSSSKSVQVPASYKGATSIGCGLVQQF